MARVVAATGPCPVRRHLVEHEVLARDEPSRPRDCSGVAASRGVGKHRRLPHRLHGTESRDRLEPLLDVEPPRPAIGSHATPIMETVRDVAGLLDFGDEHAGPEGVHGSGRNEHAVPRPRLEGVQHLVAPTAADRLREARKIDAGREAGVDPRSRLCIDDVPGLRLATIGPDQPGSTTSSG